MVNYAKMEPVWRSYGPLEPIGPSASKSKRGKRVALAGVAVVLAGGAGLGAYLKPDLDTQLPRLAASEAAAENAPAARATPEEPLRLDVMIEQMAALPLPGEMGTGGALPSETIPPSSAPVTGPEFAPSPAASAYLAPAVPAAAVAPRAAARVASAPTKLPARYSPPAASPPPRLVRQEAVAPAVTAPPRPLVLASREAPRALPIAPPEVREAPSFTCGGSMSVAQEMVCERPTLTALDRQMAAEFAAAIAAGRDRSRLQLEQDAWLARREAAAPDPNAVADAYKRRIRQLRAMH
jgi:uncharacterized protein YecT (DUF1311 family)